MPRLSWLLLVAVAACATAPPPVAVTPSAALPNDVRWTRASAEHRALFLQVYRAATERLPSLITGQSPGTWAVVMDGDETVLDNSDYQLSLARAGARFNDSTWNAWVRRMAAPALPGAVAFVAEVRRLGGHVVIVTNRDEAVCDATRANLSSIGINAAAVLCQPPGTSDKNPRFESVARGGAATGLPPLRIVMYIGDNVRDFPGITQAIRTAPASAFDEFGRSWFLLPNPMYGSWESNPVN